MSEAIIKAVDFVSLSTHDLEKAIVFYGDTLGLERSSYNPEIGAAEFETANLTLGVIDGEKMGFGHHVNDNAIALHVDDMDAARETLSERGVVFKGDTFDTGVCYMSFFTDPDGNALMLHHRYAPKDA